MRRRKFRFVVKDPHVVVYDVDFNEVGYVDYDGGRMTYEFPSYEVGGEWVSPVYYVVDVADAPFRMHIDKIQCTSEPGRFLVGKYMCLNGRLRHKTVVSIYDKNVRDLIVRLL